MTNFREIIFQLFANAGGKTISTKRTMAWIAFGASLGIVFGAQNHPHFEFALGTLVSIIFGLLGLTSVDYSSYIAEKKTEKNGGPF